ncbi:MAG: DNA recombination protein RmuC [Akkermansia sp.]|nr:DNA recombination protein RmuC [Akkermansia sp.]
MLESILMFALLGLGFVAGGWFFTQRLQKRFHGEKEDMQARLNEAEQQRELLAQQKDFLLQQHKRELDLLRQTAEKEENRWEERMKQQEERFASLSRKVLETNTNKLKEDNAEQMSAVLAPLKIQLEQLGKAVHDTNTNGASHKASLETAIKSMMAKAEALGRDAQNLALALKGDSKKQGDWGEMVLERMLEESGLRKNEEYFIQEVHKTEEGKNLRPDVVIRFPEERCVVVDSKVSLTAYANYMAAEEEETRQAALRAHVASVRSHIGELHAKDYQHVVKDTISYVLMFIPNEASYIAAVQAEPSLPLEAYQKGILIISPSNLLMALQLAYNLWQKERQVRNVEAIYDRACKMYEKMVGFQKSFLSVGAELKQAQERYDQALGQLSKGRGNVLHQMEDLRQMGINTSKRLELED